MKKLVLLFLVAGSLSGIFAPAAKALSFSVNIGDQPYYSHGSGYWDSGVYYVWVPGHYNKSHVWVHGHYRVR